MSEPSERLRVPQERRPGRNPIAAERVATIIGAGPSFARAEGYDECLVCGYEMNEGDRYLEVPYDEGFGRESVCADCVLEAAELIRREAK